MLPVSRRNAEIIDPKIALTPDYARMLGLAHGPHFIVILSISPRDHGSSGFRNARYRIKVLGVLKQQTTEANMGSVGPLEGLNAVDDSEIIVMITGFGPFKAQYPINPSWEIARSLPPLIDGGPHHANTKIRLLCYPSPIRVSYDVVHSLVPRLWTGVPRIDYMIHVGMAGGRDFYSVERRGHRDGYYMPDVDGKVLKGGTAEDWAKYGCPRELETEIDLDEVWRRWKMNLPDSDVRISEDAGRYLCDFIYYSSLAHLWKLGQDMKVLFFHVPVESDAAAIARGRSILIELVRAMVHSRTKSPTPVAAESLKVDPSV